MKTRCGSFIAGLLCTVFVWTTSAFCGYSASGNQGDMARTFYLGMTKQDLITVIGAPNRLKSRGMCLQYDGFGASIFLNSHMQADRIYLDKTFRGSLHRADNGTAPMTVSTDAAGPPGIMDYSRDSDSSPPDLAYVFKAFGAPLASEQLAYAPSSAIQNRASIELENTAALPELQAGAFPVEYRGQRKLFELYSRDRIIKYKYVLDEEGIAFYFDHTKALYATVIYPVRPRRSIQQAAAPRTETIQMETVYFDFDRYSIKADAIPVLDTCVEHILHDASLSVVIQGHTDAKGTNPYNDRLSEKRAQAVYNYFVQSGIDPGRLRVEGYGESRPAAANLTDQGLDNPEGRAKNRRVQFVITRTVP